MLRCSRRLAAAAVRVVTIAMIHNVYKEIIILQRAGALMQRKQALLSRLDQGTARALSLRLK